MALCDLRQISNNMKDIQIIADQCHLDIPKNDNGHFQILKVVYYIKK